MGKLLTGGEKRTLSQPAANYEKMNTCRRPFSPGAGGREPNYLSDGFGDPQIGVVDYETGLIHFQIAFEAAVVAFVPICVGVDSRIGLLEGLEGEIGEADPGRADHRTRADLEF